MAGGFFRRAKDMGYTTSNHLAFTGIHRCLGAVGKLWPRLRCIGALCADDGVHDVAHWRLGNFGGTRR